MELLSPSSGRNSPDTVTVAVFRKHKGYITLTIDHTEAYSVTQFVQLPVSPRLDFKHCEYFCWSSKHNSEALEDHNLFRICRKKKMYQVHNRCIIRATKQTLRQCLFSLMRRVSPCMCQKTFMSFLVPKVSGFSFLVLGPTENTL